MVSTVAVARDWPPLTLERLMTTLDELKAKERARAIGGQLRADAFAIRVTMLETYDRRPEKRQERGLAMKMAILDALEARRWRALFEEFSPTWTEHRGAWPDGHVQR